MPPDLNSLPLSPRHTLQSGMASRSMSSASHQPDSDNNNSSVSRPSTHSLAAAATLNATDRRSSSNANSPRLDRRSSDRRRSQVAMNLNLNDPTVPSPGELFNSDRPFSNGLSINNSASIGPRHVYTSADPHHRRQPSIGDIHNELEQEQEAQVNRMLGLIRAQQQQLDTLRATQTAYGPPPTSSTSSAVDDTTPQSERAFNFSSVHPAVGSVPRPPGRLSREPSSASVHQRSPVLRPRPSHDGHDWPESPSDSMRRNSSSRRSSLRDESAYYQAETANLQRENQLLRNRIRELEKQLHERRQTEATAPVVPSNLVSSPVIEAHSADK